MKKKLLKFVLIVIGLIVVFIVSTLVYVKTALPDVGEPEAIKIDYSQERIAHGKYLANSVMVCMDCHSQRDYSKFAAPMIPGTLGKGGELFGKTLGFPGDFYAPNLTPYSLKSWSDGELFRAITSGVSKNGRALFPVMPYHSYGRIDREDIYDVIAYIRTLQPIAHDVPPSKPEFPMNFIINTIPHEPAFVPKPAKEDLVDYGKYLVQAAACADCHTRQEKGKPVEGMYMAGGFEFPFPDGTVVRSLNITPDAETGIGRWTSDQFVRRFKLYSDSSFVTTSLKAGDFKTVMPWTFYATMDEGDLQAIYAYLKTIPAINNPVKKFNLTSEQALAQ
jgi:mono/diheme cytochrome c family protein